MRRLTEYGQFPKSEGTWGVGGMLIYGCTDLLIERLHLLLLLSALSKLSGSSREGLHGGTSSLVVSYIWSGMAA